MTETEKRLSDAELVKLQNDADLPNLPTQDTYWYRKAICGEGPHAYNWSDKPHRLVYDLCRIIESQAAERLSTPSQGKAAEPAQGTSAEAMRVALRRAKTHIDNTANEFKRIFPGQRADIIDTQTLIDNALALPLPVSADGSGFVEDWHTKGPPLKSKQPSDTGAEK